MLMKYSKFVTFSKRFPPQHYIMFNAKLFPRAMPPGAKEMRSLWISNLALKFLSEKGIQDEEEKDPSARES